jgi:hypothetical protein
MSAFRARTTGLSPFFDLVRVATVVAGLLNFLSQIVLRRELAPGEFGTVNTVLGLVTVLALLLLVLQLVPHHRLLSRPEAAQWKRHRPTLTRLAVFGWGGVSLLLMFSLLPSLSLPRTPLPMFAVLTLEATLGAGLGMARCRVTKRMGLLAFLVIAGASVRLAGSALAGHYQPVAESGLAPVILASTLLALPALQDYHLPPLGVEGRAVLRKLLLPLLATTSVVLALLLFSNAHRIVAQRNFGAPDALNFGFVNLGGFDDFQVAGLIAQRILGMNLLLLVVFWTKRTVLNRTTVASLRWFWIYLGALVAGVVLLVMAAPLANAIFTGNPAVFLPGFAAAVFMLGLLQGVAVFALASRRWVECFLLGGLGIAYTGFLFYAGNQPQLMTSCMFGGALISLMLVLFVGVVRYARSHP